MKLLVTIGLVCMFASEANAARFFNFGRRRAQTAEIQFNYSGKLSTQSKSRIPFLGRGTRCVNGQCNR